MTQVEMPGEGERVEVLVGAVAHGGHCVARVGGDGGPVLFVRHALPGERVIALVTEVHRGFARADAVEILTPSADRVTAPCVYAHPNRCGGCDLQHVAPAAQLAWKTSVVTEQLARLGKLTQDQIQALGVRVAPLDGDGLGWRTRVRYAVDGRHSAGLLKHRSHEVVPVDRCLIAHPSIQAAPVTSESWPDADEVHVVASGGGDVLVTPRRSPLRLDEPDILDGASVAGEIREKAVGREWVLPGDAFWQVHPAAADTLAAAVLELLVPRPGEAAWDLYGGAGLFAAALAGMVGPTGPVTVVESAPQGVAAARRNLTDLPGVAVIGARVEAALRQGRLPKPVDLIVLDPPRSGAGAAVVKAITRTGARAVAYVACDPAAFARDVATFRAAGWRLAELRAFDLFPMTHHVECVGLLLPPATR
ncbi:tRNA/tmRNA/rRNA uracil-C5-methylase (TrmA/RlmC/RlmD family) [Catenuloplanes nepalensis]|uniref:tRNA/tmRNA/rRNA uracil-C5-methylase (TrmA/RlmC/RlmD family) n=1 Tax=Catenuloplanes nepalensis TaxID=587533 RepID=A0ABT9MZS7_9ACTN|nr:TRAM domain-containing protein [Catenuloplanes nepalensis]MDP9796949.1 tRNA/tmRNA/rRNA uracil-C5-methylase (TrmA/RlmC/RlmD family) [Catenuloplanes nepalensis]